MGYEVTIVKGIEISRNYAFLWGRLSKFWLVFFLGCDENPFGHISHEGWTQLFDDGTKKRVCVRDLWFLRDSMWSMWPMPDLGSEAVSFLVDTDPETILAAEAGWTGSLSRLLDHPMVTSACFSVWLDMVRYSSDFGYDCFRSKHLNSTAYLYW